MAQDLRTLFAKEREKKSPELKQGHEARFLSKLEAELPAKESSKNSRVVFWLQIAASVIFLLGIGFYFLNDSSGDKKQKDTQIVNQDNVPQNETTISLGDLSPDLKKIESYYLSNINLELSGLEIDTNNKEVIDGFMERLSELDAEYRRLNKELNELGPNDQTINALVKNLQLRLQLLQRLKSKLNQLKSSKNEQKSSHIV